MLGAILIVCLRDKYGWSNKFKKFYNKTRWKLGDGYIWFWEIFENSRWKFLKNVFID